MVTIHTTCFNNQNSHNVYRVYKCVSRDSQIRQRLLTQRQSTDVHTAISEGGREGGSGFIYIYIYIYIKIPKQLQQRRNTETALAE